MFDKAKGKNKRLKMLLWGDSGTGKTVLSLQFPGVCAIDPEGGTDQYGDVFDFGVERPQSFDQVMALVEELAKGNHDFKTLVIDQMSWVWASVQEKWRDILMAKRKIRDPANFQFTFGDWNFIKGDNKLLIRRLHKLDMNVILIARSKTEYSDTEMAKKVGDKPDCESSLPYDVDVVCNLRREIRQGEAVFLALQSKDRTNKLPNGEFEFNSKKFLELLGPSFNKPAVAVELPQTQEQIDSEKVERADLITSIKQISDGWKPADDGSWSDFKERAIGVVPANKVTIQHLRTLSDAIIEKLANQAEPEPETQVEPEPVVETTKAETPAVKPLEPEVPTESKNELTVQTNRVGWDAFNKVYFRIAGNVPADSLSDDIQKAIVEELKKLPASLAKAHGKDSKPKAGAKA